MGYNDQDYDDDYDSGSRSSGSSSHSRYHDGERETKFATGITRLLRLPPELSTAIDGIAAKIKSTIIDSGGDKVHAYALSLAETFAKTSLGKKLGFTNTQVAARTAEAVFSLGIAVGDKIVGYQDTTRNYYKALQDTAKSIAPVLREANKTPNKKGKAGIRQLLRVQGNEVITFKREQIYNLFKGNMTANITSTLDAIPILLPEIEKRRKKAAQEDAIINDPNAHYKAMKEEFDALDPDYRSEFTGVRDYMDHKHSYGAGDGHTQVPDDGKGLGKWIEDWGPLIGGAGFSAVARRIAQNAEDKFNKPCALDMILKLRDELKHDPRAQNIEGMGLQEYVVEIFQQNQRDHHRPTIGERFYDRFHPATEAIADAIQRGKMDPLALVNLIGENRIVRKSGKTFAGDRELDYELKRQMDMLPAEIHVDLNNFYAEAPFTHKDVVEVLGNLQGEERAFFASLFPDTVLKKGGMKPYEIRDSRRKLGEHYFELLATGVQELSQLSDDQLKAKKLTEHEIGKLRDVAEKVKTDGEKAVFDAVGEPGEEGIEAVVRNAGMACENRKGFWAELVKRTHAAKDHGAHESSEKAKLEKKTETITPPPASHIARQNARETTEVSQSKNL